jgi:hypothetical protein
MTRWGVLLLLVYLALGLGRLDPRQASRLAIGATVVVIAAVSVKVGVM